MTLVRVSLICGIPNYVAKGDGLAQKARRWQGAGHAGR